MWHSFLPSRLDSLNWAAPHGRPVFWGAARVARPGLAAALDAGCTAQAVAPLGRASIRWSPPRAPGKRGCQLLALTIDYGQRHRVRDRWRRADRATLDVVRHIVLHARDITRFGGSALTADIEVPKGGVVSGHTRHLRYGRNTVFLSLALACGERGRRLRHLYRSQCARLFGLSGLPPISLPPFERLAGLATKAGAEGRGSGSWRRSPHAKADYRARGLPPRPRHGLSGRDTIRPRGHGIVVATAAACDRGGLRGRRPAGSHLLCGARMSYAVKEIFLTLQGEGCRPAAAPSFSASPAATWSGREQERRGGPMHLLRHRFRRHRRRVKAAATTPAVVTKHGSSGKGRAAAGGGNRG